MENQRLLDLINLAIRREEEACDFYMDMHGRITDAATRDTIAFIAGEEKKHRASLEGYRDGHLAPYDLRISGITFYRIAEHQEEPEVVAGMNIAEVFLVAAHRELRSHDFYVEFAGIQQDGTVREMLLRMAGEELKHKEKMEYLYANAAFPQTDGG